MNRFIDFAAVAALVVIGVVVAFAISACIAVGFTFLVHWYYPIDRDLTGRIFNVVFVCVLLVEAYLLLVNSSTESN